MAVFGKWNPKIEITKETKETKETWKIWKFEKKTKHFNKIIMIHSISKNRNSLVWFNLLNIRSEIRQRSLKAWRFNTYISMLEGNKFQKGIPDQTNLVDRYR